MNCVSTIRVVTERAETIESGSAMLSGFEPASMLLAVDVALRSMNEWQPPMEYLTENVSATVAKVVLGHPHTTWWTPPPIEPLAGETVFGLAALQQIRQ